MSDGSHALVDIECDGCGKLLINVKWQRYKKYQKEDGKYYCQGCSKILFNKIKYIETACTGIGKYKPWVNGVITTQYNAWRNMLMRCYDEKNFLKQPTYEDCTVCEEWHNFQNFAKWYDDNYYEVEGNSTQIDKDILVKGNKIYSPDTCCFVPQNINKLLTNSSVRRGLYPIGVISQNNQYGASCRDGSGTRIHLGLYKTPELAFEAYKIYKEESIKILAEKHYGLIPKNVYNALIEYKVEITD